MSSDHLLIFLCAFVFAVLRGSLKACLRPKARMTTIASAEESQFVQLPRGMRRFLSWPASLLLRLSRIWSGNPRAMASRIHRWHDVLGRQHRHRQVCLRPNMLRRDLFIQEKSDQHMKVPFWCCFQAISFCISISLCLVIMFGKESDLTRLPLKYLLLAFFFEHSTVLTLSHVMLLLWWCLRNTLRAEKKQVVKGEMNGFISFFAKSTLSWWWRVLCLRVEKSAEWFYRCFQGRFEVVRFSAPKTSKRKSTGTLRREAYCGYGTSQIFHTFA